MSNENGRWTRRRFLQTAGSLSAFAGTRTAAFAADDRGVFLVSDPSGGNASAAEAHWATKVLEQALLSKGVKMLRGEKLSRANSSDLCIITAGSTAPGSVAMLKNAGVQIASVPEALGLLPAKSGGKDVVLACGYDPRGLVYALLELADRARHSSDPARHSRRTGRVVHFFPGAPTVLPSSGTHLLARNLRHGARR